MHRKMFRNVHTKGVLLSIPEYEIIADFFGLFFLLLWIFKSYNNKPTIFV